MAGRLTCASAEKGGGAISRLGNISRGWHPKGLAYQAIEHMSEGCRMKIFRLPSDGRTDIASATTYEAGAGNRGCACT